MLLLLLHVLVVITTTQIMITEIITIIIIKQILVDLLELNKMDRREMGCLYHWKPHRQTHNHTYQRAGICTRTLHCTSCS